MIERQLLITGAPRSGTSLFQKMLRDHRSFWSFPSESELVWHLYCHPRFNQWDSESFGADHATQEVIDDIRHQLELFTAPAGLWRMVEKFDFIWSNKRSKMGRTILRNIYLATYPKLRGLIPSKKVIYYLDKTHSNSLRMGFVNQVFPESKVLYLTRNGFANVNSLINAWRHPSRFFNYDLPVELRIKGYEFKPWCFVLPSGWRKFVDRPLEEVCVFQWEACHQAMLDEIAKPHYEGRVLQVKLEDITSHPKRTLQRITEFAEIPWDSYFETLSRNLPMVNSPDNNPDPEKWKKQNPQELENVRHLIEKLNARLGY